MISISNVRAHAGAILRELLRTPAFVIPSIGFPAMFYAIIGLMYSRTNAAAADFTMCSFMAFALVGITLFQFGVGIATERGRPWERYLRTLPVTVATRFAARVCVALVFGIAAAGLVALIARLFAPIDFTALQWLQIAAYALVGAIPFVMLGIAIAYWVAPRGALPVTNILYLLGSIAGGLWMPPQILPPILQSISPYVPMRQYAELLWSVAQRGHDPLRAALMLSGFVLVFGAAGIVGYRRDERSRYA
ncbi:MAG TPA: ABC transporter permease [Candidatus Baltobacteraceae bacterium]|nr:ABC transporter permease [Candidatus Baltobacteraceae bacterium]